MVGVGKVDAGRAHLVELLAVAGAGVGEVDDVEDLGPPKQVICTARMPIRLGICSNDHASRPCCERPGPGSIEDPVGPTDRVRGRSEQLRNGP